MTMRNLPISERPYERLIGYGADSLSNAELLAIIIKTGTREKTVLEIAKDILMLDSENSLSNINNLEISELMSIKGIGKIKAIQIKAVFELAKRISMPKYSKKYVIKSSRDVYELLKYRCINEVKENLFVLNMNIKNEVIKISCIARGGKTKISIEISEVLSDAIKINAPNIIIVHNHPSGDTKPSKADISFTYKLCEATTLMGITLIDHVIISNVEYTSLKEKGFIV